MESENQNELNETLNNENINENFDNNDEKNNESIESQTTIYDFLVNYFKSDKVKKIFRFTLNIFLVVLAFFVFSNFGFISMFATTLVSGKSMQPTFNPNITVGGLNDINNEIAIYKSEESYFHGDVIISKYNGYYVIKRIIAKGGDRVKFDINPQTNEYEVYLNGELLVEPYLDEKYDDMKQHCADFNRLKKDSNWSMNFDNEGYLLVPQGYIFYLGDNRSNSADCSQYGPQSETNVVGKVYYKVSATTDLDSINFLFTKMKILYGYIFKNLQPNF